MSVVTFSGLASGIDTNRLVSRLMDIAKTPIRRLEAQKTALASKQTKFEDIRNKLDDLMAAVMKLDSRTEVSAMSVSSSDSATVTAIAGENATEGSYLINITQLAQAEITQSDPVADPNATIANSKNGISINGKDPVTVGSNRTLYELAGDITANISGVTASVAWDGAVSAYRLYVTGQTGSANAISFTDSTALNLDVGGNQTQTAMNSAFTVDGVPKSSSTNTGVTNGITNATLSLNAIGSATLTLTRGNATTNLTTSLGGFVTAYNELATAIADEFAWTDSRKADSLSGDSTLRNMQTDLRKTLQQTITVPGTYDHLSDIGLSFQRDGTISLDESKLLTAMSTDAAGVASLLADAVSGTDGLMKQIQPEIDKFSSDVDGRIKARVDGFTDRIRNIDKQIDRLELRLIKYEDTLQKQYSSMETIISTMQGQGAALTSILMGLG